MKKYLLLCIVSSCLGGFVATLVRDVIPARTLAAQESQRAVEGELRFRAPARNNPEPPAPAEPLRGRDNNLFTDEELVNIQVYEKANRGVVHITTRSAVPDRVFMIDLPAEGSGSGSVLDKQGHLLTNYHVIEGARMIRATLFNGEEFDAEPVGADPDNDVAVLKIDAPAELLHPVLFADESLTLRVGQKVYAFGNPFGLERTMTVGIISSLNRQIPSRTQRTMKSIIQIDAALNRGNSGGPLLNSRGELIGMNTAIASRTGENTGVGFAIPVSSVRRVVPQLVKHGRVIRPDLGITRVYQVDNGLVIATLAPGGPAEQAGLRGFQIIRKQTRRGPFIYEETQVDQSHADLIVAVDGQRVRSVDDLLTVVEAHKPGERVTVTVIRDNREQNISVRLGDG